MARKIEERLQSAISTYIKLKYPDVIFTSESSGIRVPMHMAIQMKKQRSMHKLPDMIILEPNNQYKGLCMELKKDRSIYKKDGSLRKSDHVEEQSKTLKILEKKGYKAVFACGVDECIRVVDGYMANRYLSK